MINSTKNLKPNMDCDCGAKWGVSSFTVL